MIFTVSPPAIVCRFGQVLGASLLLVACTEPASDDTEGAGDSDEAGEAEAGETDQAVTDGAGTGDPTGGPGGTGGPDIEVGPNFGLLSFTYYPATASGLPEELGMAGAWRTAAFTTDDFYAVQAWSMHLPPPPAKADTLENNMIPAPYEWGKKDTWVTSGNAIKLRKDGAESVACLAVVDATYPVYVSDDAEGFDPACAPDPTRWTPGAYDLVAFGGETWDDVVLPGAVVAPAALTVTGPLVEESLHPVDRASDLAIAWDADGAPEDRVVIRLIDTFGQTLTAHAADDGSFTIPAAELGKLTPGPATLTIARERIHDIGLPAGTLRVAVRYEVWTDPDLL